MATISNPLIRARGSVALRSGVRMHSPRTTPTSPISAAAAAAATCRQRLPTLIAHQRPLSSSPRCVPLTNRYFSSSSSNSDNNTSTAEQQAQQLKQVRFEDVRRYNNLPSVTHSEVGETKEPKVIIRGDYRSIPPPQPTESSSTSANPPNSPPRESFRVPCPFRWPRNRTRISFPRRNSRRGLGFRNPGVVMGRRRMSWCFIARLG